MKKSILFPMLLLLLLCGCRSDRGHGQIAATTLPVYTFTQALCQNTGLTVERLISEPVSCLHDYFLKVEQVQHAEAAEIIVISGAGLEDFMTDILLDKSVIDASAGIPLLCGEEDHGDHGHDDDHHSHAQDPHIWLSPNNAMIMAQNICEGLCRQYPQYETTFSENLSELLQQLSALSDYGHQALGNLQYRDMITFHDGFAYFADAFDLTVLAAVEEESGSEASAKELIALIQLVRAHQLPAVFTEINGSPSAASVISSETGAKIYSLDMAMASDSYFTAMYHNIDTIQEALG